MYLRDQNYNSIIVLVGKNMSGYSLGVALGRILWLLPATQLAPYRNPPQGSKWVLFGTNTVLNQSINDMESLGCKLDMAACERNVGNSEKGG